MIKISVTTEKQGDILKTKCKGDVAGERYILAHEVTAILKELHKIDDGQMLVVAFGDMLEDLTKDTLEGHEHD